MIAVPSSRYSNRNRNSQKDDNYYTSSIVTMRQQSNSRGIHNDTHQSAAPMVEHRILFLSRQSQRKKMKEKHPTMENESIANHQPVNQGLCLEQTVVFNRGAELIWHCFSLHLFLGGRGVHSIIFPHFHRFATVFIDFLAFASFPLGVSLVF